VHQRLPVKRNPNIPSLVCLSVEGITAAAKDVKLAVSISNPAIEDVEQLVPLERLGDNVIHADA
jgi:hypothetical protein